MSGNATNIKYAESLIKYSKNIIITNWQYLCRPILVANAESCSKSRLSFLSLDTISCSSLFLISIVNFHLHWSILSRVEDCWKEPSITTRLLFIYIEVPSETIEFTSVTPRRKQYRSKKHEIQKMWQSLKTWVMQFIIFYLFRLRKITKCLRD